MKLIRTGKHNTDSELCKDPADQTTAIMSGTKSLGHVKFDDDENFPTLKAKKPIENKPKKQYDISDDSESDDDNAPEEEGVLGAKDNIDLVMQMREDAFKLEQKMLKEKRRKQNESFTKQQQAKKEKPKAHIQTTRGEDQLLEELSSDFFDKLANAKSISEPIRTMPTRINFNDLDDEENYIPEIKAQIQRKKKKTLKKLRANSIKKGPVTVSILSDLVETKAMAPKKEISIVSSKDRWLKRKSLDRKK